MPISRPGTDPEAEALAAAYRREAGLAAEPGDDDDDDDEGGRDDQGEGEGKRAGRVDVLEVLDAMSERYHEHRREMLERWSWPFFCAQWARLLDYARREKRKKQRRARQQRQQATAAELEQRLTTGVSEG
ncbi:MAG TPA: hypothetical protein VFU72_09225 [Nitrolancea sp.]|nr:hypothetical protein [Nitrolancea sp.]